MKKVKRMNKEYYWKCRNIYRKSKLNIQSKKYNTLRNKINKNDEKMYNLIILKELIKQLIKGISILLILYLSDYFGRIVIHTNSFLIITNDLKKHLSICLNVNFFSDTLIGAIAVAGVFLGLYYSNMSSIFTEKYSNAPKEMRDLFTNELITNSNINNVIKYIIISLMILALNSIGISPWYITVIVMFIFTIKVIVTFSIIGKRTYEFSDTYSISKPIYKFIVWNIKNSTVFGYNWNDASFQNHYKRECSKMIDNLRIINSYNLENNHIKTRSLLNFMKMNLLVLSDYLSNKKYIPYNSYWYKEKHEYKRWYEASDDEISIALNTGTIISTVKKKYHNWFEDEILQINYLCLNKFIKDNNIDAILEYVDIFSETIKIWSKSCNPEECVNIMKNLDNMVSGYLSNSNNDEAKELSLADNINFMYLEYVVTINDFLMKHSNFNEIDYSNYNLYSIESLLKLGYSFLNNGNVFSIFEAIQNELSIENKKITPDWYIKEKIYKEFYSYLINLNNSLMKIYNECIYKMACKYIEEKKYRHAMVYLSRESEFFSKINIAFELIEKLEKIAVQGKKQVSDNWQENNILSNKNYIYNIHKDMPKQWVKCTIVFIDTRFIRNKEYPDFLGFCYNNLCEYLIATLEKNDFNSFKSAYKNFLPLCLIYQDFIRTDLIESNRTNSIAAANITISPLIEFFQISGYATLVGEFTKNKIWSEDIKSYLDSISQKLLNDNKKIFEDWIDIVKAKRNLPTAIYNRDMIYRRWQQRIHNSVINNKLVQFKSVGHFGEKILDTESDLLKRIYSIHDSYLNMKVDAYEVFIICYVNKYVLEDKKLHGKRNWDNLGVEVDE